MTLKERISADHMTAFKAKDNIKKTILSVVKSEITSNEKKGVEMNDEAVTKLLIKTRKNLQESLDVRADESIKNELTIISSYLPEAMSTAEIATVCLTILSTMPEGLPENARIGKAMGMFTKQFPGRANPKDVMTIIKSL